MQARASAAPTRSRYTLRKPAANWFAPGFDDARWAEGPHLYKRGGYYHLLTAEGGTGWGHADTLARSRTLTGPYELHPDVYALTSRHRPDIELQRAGHADLVETQTGDTYMVHLCGRPIRNRGRCVLGRETAIQRMQWCADGWLRTGVRSMMTNASEEPCAAVTNPEAETSCATNVSVFMDMGPLHSCDVAGSKRA